MEYAVTAAFLLSVVAGSFAAVILGGYGIAQLIALALWAWLQAYLKDQHLADIGADAFRGKKAAAISPVALEEAHRRLISNAASRPKRWTASADSPETGLGGLEA
jgi:hypothetical protein